MESLKNRPCGNCGAMAIETANLKDQWVDGPWKDFPRVYVTRELTQYRCGKCGELAGTRSSAKAFDEAIRESIKDQVSQFINKITKRSRLNLKTIAERLSMGYQHLSDLRNHRSFPSYHYWSLLHKTSKDPDLLDRLNPHADEEPPLSQFG